MPSSWLEEAEQFQHDRSNNIASLKKAQNSATNVESPDLPGLIPKPQSIYPAQLPNNGTLEAYSRYSWGAGTSQEQMRAMMATQYPDDINRSGWNESRPNNDLDYSPAFSDSPIISSTACQTRSSDMDSLFEDSDSEGEILMPQSRSAGEAYESTIDARLHHSHDQPSSCGLSQQLQGQLNVLSSEAGDELQEPVHAEEGYSIHPAMREGVINVQLPDNGPQSNANAATSRSTSQRHEQLQERREEPGTRHENIHDCPCGCSTSDCPCHPSYCECLGCNHAEQARQLEAEAEMRWGYGEPSGDQSCGCRDPQKQCSCLPGLCHCTTCSEHKIVEPAKHCGCGTGGQRRRYQPNQCECTDCDEHESRVDDEELTEREVHREQAAGYQSEENVAASSIRALQQINHYVGDKHTVIATDATHACPCIHGGVCSCFVGRCGCDKVHSAREAGETCSQQDLPRQPSLCRDGRDCTNPPGACSCGKAEPTLEARTLHREELVGFRRASTWAPSQDYRPLHLKLAELIENPTARLPPEGNALTFNRKGSMLPTSQAVTPAFSKQGSISSIIPSRPDTPRPPTNSTPSTPYAADVLQDYVQQSIEPRLLRPNQEDVRQSVEPELPPTNWTHEPTPAYVDRSFTPSPFSRRDTDVEMRDVSGTVLPGDLGRELSLPPPTSQPELAVSGRLAKSPVQPTLPPIPDTDAIKQPKRGERKKPGVQGSKVEKRLATGSTPRQKSRNVTRKPTVSVGKLVDKAKKKTKEAVENAEGTGQGQNRGKVAAAVAKIEQQVKQQDAEKNLKQKDGTAVRRSRRANKGVRTSFGYT